MDQQAWKTPSRAQAAWFWLRSRCFIVERGISNLLDRSIKRWPVSSSLSDAPVIASVRVSLWDDERAGEFILLAGKVENLRIASRALNAVVVPANTCLSFWRQLGRPSESRGYVVGREIREGCVIPTIAGGLCQLSNALATAVMQAGFELVERHAHTARSGRYSENETQVDATVFWNYVDLRIRAPMPWRLEVELTSSELVLAIRAFAPAPSTGKAPQHKVPHSAHLESHEGQRGLRSCLNCDEVGCFRHQAKQRSKEGATAWLMDGASPEFLGYLARQSPPTDRLQPLPPRRLGEWLSRKQVVDPWVELATPASTHVRYVVIPSLYRAWLLRRAVHFQGRRQAAVIAGAERLVTSFGRALRPEHTHLIVDQGLLPHLHQRGVLAGRNYDVLAPALPMAEIHRRLDLAAQGNESTVGTLKDFRADEVLVRAELQAMRQARQIITAHGEVAEYWRGHGGLHVIQLPWVFPMAAVQARQRAVVPTVVFPASALARKGAYELAEALREVRCRLLILGSRSDDELLWSGIDASHVGWQIDAWVPYADVVVLPAYVEHSPRALLVAVSAGIPVIATSACGLGGLAGVSVVSPGNVSSLRHAIVTALAQR